LRPFAWIRRPVRREGAERYLLLTLVSFAGTVIATRWFLDVTGFPRIGGGDLHIAHALWGGLVLFVASILPILFAGRSVYQLAAALSGVGIGLFIDEVGKFITARNDYFYPAAAPIIYATFLLAVLVWLRARRPHDADPRSQLLGALEMLEESVESDLQSSERDEIRERLAATATAPTDAAGPEQRRLAAELLSFLDAQQLMLAPDRPGALARLRDWWSARRERWLGGRGLRLLIVVALLISGVTALVALVTGVTSVLTDPPEAGTRLFGLNVLHLAVEALAGVLLIAGAVLVGVVGRHRLGWTLAYFGLLVALTLADLVSFYLRQFDSIETAMFHLALLAGVVASRSELAAEPWEARDAPGASRPP
jgi:hypothetical protein